MELDLLDGALYAGDPDPAYAWLRANAPVYWDGENELWAISRYEDVVAIEKDAETFCSRQGFRPGLPSDESMIGRDDPRHLAQRRVLNKIFTPRRVRECEAQLRTTVGRLIDTFAARGECDVVAELAIPVPVITIIEMIGFDADAWPRFAEYAEESNAAGGGPRYFTEAVIECVKRFSEECLDLIRRRRIKRRDDLMSLMLDACEADLPRGDEQLMLESLLLLNGGSDTTRHVIAGAALALAQNPEQRNLLAREPARIPVAVEEFIRWVTPILNMRRTATRDVTLNGATIFNGQQVLLMYGSANRDERVFDEPGQFDVTRHPNPQLAFGFGTHFCLGASLARLELRIVFEELLRRLPDFRLAPDAELEWIPNAFTRGLATLSVEFTPSSAG